MGLWHGASSLGDSFAATFVWHWFGLLTLYSFPRSVCTRSGRGLVAAVVNAGRRQTRGIIIRRRSRWEGSRVGGCTKTLAVRQCLFDLLPHRAARFDPSKGGGIARSAGGEDKGREHAVILYCIKRRADSFMANRDRTAKPINLSRWLS